MATWGVDGVVGGGDGIRSENVLLEAFGFIVISNQFFTDTEKIENKLSRSRTPWTKKNSRTKLEEVERKSKCKIR